MLFEDSPYREVSGSPCTFEQSLGQQLGAQARSSDITPSPGTAARAALRTTRVVIHLVGGWQTQHRVLHFCTSWKTKVRAGTMKESSNRPQTNSLRGYCRQVVLSRVHGAQGTLKREEGVRRMKRLCPSRLSHESLSISFIYWASRAGASRETFPWPNKASAGEFPLLVRGAPVLRRVEVGEHRVGSSRPPPPLTSDQPLTLVHHL